MNNPQELAQAYMRLRSQEVRKNPSLLNEPSSVVDYKDVMYRLLGGRQEETPLTIFIYELGEQGKQGSLNGLIVSPKMEAISCQEVIENLSKKIVERFNKYVKVREEIDKDNGTYNREKYLLMRCLGGLDLELIKTMNNGEIEKRNVSLFDLASANISEFNRFYAEERRLYTNLGGTIGLGKEELIKYLKEFRTNAKVEQDSLYGEYVQAVRFFEGNSFDKITFANLSLVGNKFIKEADDELPFKINSKESMQYKIDALGQFVKGVSNTQLGALGNVTTIEYEPIGERYALTAGGRTYSLDKNDIRDNGALERLEKDVALRAEYLDVSKNYSKGEIPPYGDIAKDILDKNDDVCSFRSEIANRFDEYNKKVIYQDEAIRKPIKTVEMKPEIKAESLNL